MFFKPTWTPLCKEDGYFASWDRIKSQGSLGLEGTDVARRPALPGFLYAQAAWPPRPCPCFSDLGTMSPPAFSGWPSGLQGAPLLAPLGLVSGVRLWSSGRPLCPGEAACVVGLLPARTADTFLGSTRGGRVFWSLTNEHRRARSSKLCLSARLTSPSASPHSLSTLLSVAPHGPWASGDRAKQTPGPELTPA